MTDLDLSPHAAGNTGIAYVHSFDGRHPGPHVMLVALIHGNEICGAIALDYLLRKAIRPSRGKLTLCFANVDAFDQYDRDNPGAARFVDEDMNRLWDANTLNGPRDSTELRRARVLAPIVETADFLLDLHSMQLRGSPLVLAGGHRKGRNLGGRIGLNAPIIVDLGHRAGTRLRDFSGFGDARDPRTALLVECGQHRDGESVTVALYSALRFAQAAGVLSEDEIAPHLAAPPVPHAAGRTIEVTESITSQTGAFSFVEPFGALTVIKRAGTLIGRDGDQEIRTPYDDCYLILPARLAGPGQTAVRMGRVIE